MRHNQLTVIAPLKDEQRDALATYLEREIGYQRAAKPANALLKGIAGLHFLNMSTFVSPGNGQGYLVIEASFDGPLDAFLKEFTTKFAQQLNIVLNHCERCPNESPAKFILRHSYKPECFYVSCPGLTRCAIDTEHKLLKRLRAETATMVDEGAASYCDCGKVIARLRDVARVSGFLASPPPAVPFVVEYGPCILRALGALILMGLAAIVVLAFGWPLLVLLGLAVLYGVYQLAPAKSKILFLSVGALALLVSGVGVAALSLFVPAWVYWAARVILTVLLILAGGIGYALYRIELLERVDRIDPGWVNVHHVRDICRDENSKGCMHNHFINLSVVKPGALRRWTLRLVLWAVHYLGILYFNNGKLGGIPSIHFARWVMLDQKEFGKPLLLFLTNYDGSWDSYLGDFVDEASQGVSGMWSNTGGFPRTWGVTIGGGSRYEKQFKAYARQGQQRSSAWFSAYPNLSVGQKLSNAELRRALDKDNLDAGGQDALLRRL